MKRSEVERAKREALSALREAGIALAKDEEIEITDFGKDDFGKLGLGLVIRVNEPEYASKWLTVKPGQECPNHYHAVIKETFFVVRGDVTIWIGADVLRMKAGDKVTMAAGTWHRFSSKGGAVIEEITTRQVPDDSYFEDPGIRRYVTVAND